MLLIREPGGPPTAGEMADLERVAGSDPDTATLVVTAPDSPELWTCLGAALDSVRDDGSKALRLVMSRAGVGTPDGPPLARRIADAWEIEVIASDATVLIVPGGSLFTFGSTRHDGGWWRFSPGEEPRPLGLRTPAPAWQSDLAELPGATAGGCLIEQIPAGVLVRPTRVRPPVVGDLCYAVPMEPDRATLLVAAADTGAHVPSVALADLLASLPGPVRTAARLVPGGATDLLPLAQDVADLTGDTVEVMTAIPLAAHDPDGTAFRPVLLGPGAVPTWRPFVESVICRPAPEPDALLSPAPLLGRWHPPVPALDLELDETVPGTVRLPDGWQATVTRSGLAVVRQGTSVALAAEPPDPLRMTIDIGRPGQPVDDSVMPALYRLLMELDADTRAQTVLRVRGVCVDGGRRLRRFAVRHGVALLPIAAPGPDIGHATVRMTETAPPSRTVGDLSHAGHTNRRVSPEPRASAVPDLLAGPLTMTEATGSTPLRLPPASETPGHMTAGTPQSVTSPSGPDPDPAPVPPARPVEGQPGPAGECGPNQSESAGVETVPPAATAVPVGGTSSPKPTGPEAPAPARPAPAPAPARASREAGSEEPPSAPRPLVAAGAATARAGHRPATVARPLPFTPAHHSTSSDRDAFRDLAKVRWDSHHAAVARTLLRMPALRSLDQETVRADLVAVHLYLTSAPGPLHHVELARSLRTGETDLLPYAACLTSGLRNLSAYRGVVVRGGPDLPAVPEAGQVLYDPAPFSALTLNDAQGPGVRYAIWATTARRAGALLGGNSVARNELVFAPGTRLRMLAVHEDNGQRVVLLRELAQGSSRESVAEGLDEEDNAALGRLQQALEAHTFRSDPGWAWPERCEGPLAA
ncbi:hypothetical protein ABZ770_16580 [Streptomyces sp. NPDC006654]|uniref:hypothetical protein n=1 Tax=Streptomyces sp. NPDC006654 TaxID=3156897 RepID=UPI003400F69F